MADLVGQLVVDKLNGLPTICASETSASGCGPRRRGPRATCRRTRSVVQRLRELCKCLCDLLVNPAPERHHQRRHARKRFPAPFAEFGIAAVGRTLDADVDLALFAREAEREPFLALATKGGQPVRRTVVGR